ncbi:tRNA uridine-5-carboxymethylaminomethyl(34) synthesis GTPase MnmE [Phreatobacter sp. AB_2022a]|uniref:tRNA uridine-5-carboxymethylaminomethyl(34) synthesis GTPase MnmE n=1 Tax=Phreatobacter sp. AB_2022a TaxID=3003134 RepID=UPI002287042B|nr:tRNA uridine-5-carboxymethylaminomethyl(34) synthesis GTPase MnmE [Phreatobacter sp. AB_2022a]MCZ0736061.1 tRNA uridine-5-carboxymethylaminomethyl(34) synthesis GTPase MnmE [Phreatobacter sp. AB_2022a]
MTTIAALSTAPGMAGVAIIRISGPAAGPVLERLAGKRPRPRFATNAVLRQPDGEPIDSALILWFPAPGSFTGEDVAELHVHGGRAVTTAVLRTVLAVPGLRVAEPGEFTRRAFENGKMDLAAVEGLADLIGAETEGQRRQAYAQYASRLGQTAERLRATMIHALALVEATIDFPDEDDVGASALSEARSIIEKLDGEVLTLLADSHRGERVRDGLHVAIAGPPNAGKSTLLNTLAGRDVAIVSPIAGTTRDTLEVHLDLDGMAFILTDTAGLREGIDPIEAEGVRRAHSRMRESDLVLFLQTADPSEAMDPDWDLGQQVKIWHVRSQIDRFGSDMPHDPFYRHHISAVQGVGIRELLADLSAFGRDLLAGEPAVLVRERHRQVFQTLHEALAESLAIDDWSAAAELVAEDLRTGLNALGRATGRVDVEAVLDVVFSSFCIGK